MTSKETYKIISLVGGLPKNADLVCRLSKPILICNKQINVTVTVPMVKVTAFLMQGDCVPHAR